MDILSYILSKKNNGSNTGGSGGSGEITYESAFAKLLPNGVYEEDDIGTNVIDVLSGAGSNVSVSLYDVNNQNVLSTDTIRAGRFFILNIAMNIETMEIKIDLYGQNGGAGVSLETTSSNLIANNYVNQFSCVSITDITATSGKFVPLGGIVYAS